MEHCVKQFNDKFERSFNIILLGETSHGKSSTLITTLKALGYSDIEVLHIDTSRGGNNTQCSTVLRRYTVSKNDCKICIFDTPGRKWNNDQRSKALLSKLLSGVKLENNFIELLIAEDGVQTYVDPNTLQADPSNQIDMVWYVLDHTKCITRQTSWFWSSSSNFSLDKDKLDPFKNVQRLLQDYHSVRYTPYNLITHMDEPTYKPFEKLFINEGYGFENKIIGVSNCYIENQKVLERNDFKNTTDALKTSIAVFATGVCSSISDQ